MVQLGAQGLAAGLMIQRGVGRRGAPARGGSVNSPEPMASESLERLVRVLGEAVRNALDVSENATPAQAVEAATRELAAALGASAVSLMIADLSGRALVRMTEIDLRASADGARQDGTDLAQVFALDGGPAEQALRTQSIQVLPPGAAGVDGADHARWTVIAPVSERGDTAGLLVMSLPSRPPPEVLEEIGRSAHLLAFVLIAARRHTDLFEWGQRTTPFSLSAEIQRRLLPSSFTCEGGSFSLSAWLEPAASVGGDTFDYSVAREHLRFSITDAMGHGVGAALAASLCVGSLRGTRRRGGNLLDQAQDANMALIENASEVAAETYVTGMLGTLELSTGQLQLVNAGHVAPILSSADGGQPRQLDLPPDLPFGMFRGTQYRATSVQLRAGDRLVLVTDGMTERNATDVDLAGEISRTRHLHPREACRYLADAVLASANGRLGDDATLMLVDWHDTHGQPRHSMSGADAALASARLP